jgi:LPS export ABC transporter protein LptC
VRPRIWAALLLALGTLFVALQKSRVPEDVWAQGPEGEKPPDAHIEGFHLISTVRGVKQWELYSRTARLYQDRKQAHVDEIYVEYFKDDKVASTLTADKGVIHTDTHDTLAEGHVELIAENGAKLETDRLHWDGSSERIHTESRVRIYKGLDDITAVGLESDAKLDLIRFKRDVHTRVRDTKEIEHFDRPKRF